MERRNAGSPDRLGNDSVIDHAPLPALLSRALLALFVLGGAILCYFITVPFMAALVWSITLAVLFAPLDRFLRPRVRSPAISVTLTMVVVVLLVVVPVLFVSRAIVQAILSSAHDFESMLATDWRATLEGVPAVRPVLRWVDANLDVGTLAGNLSAVVQRAATDLLWGSLASLITLLLTFYFLFYFLRDGRAAMAAAERILPLSRNEFSQLSVRLRDTIYATVWGIAVVSMIQGLLGGVMFWWLGLPSPVFWGFAMGLLAIVPFLGAFVIWVPAAILLALDGQWIPALVLTIWGTLIVGLIDNVLYPILVGRRLAQHSVVAFIAIVGGIAVFGAHGFVLGPLVIAATLSLLEILRSRLDKVDSGTA